MTVVSSKEFAANQEKYFGMALNEQIYIRNGENMFTVSMTEKYEEPNMIFEPDEDFYRSMSMDEFIEKAMVRLEKIDTMYAKK